MRHQPSSMEAGRKDIKMFARYCHEKNVRKIYGATLPDYVHWLSDDHKNGAGAINRKCSSLREYIKHLRLRQVPGALDFPIEFLPRARSAYSGPVRTLEPEEVECLLDSIDTSNMLGFRDYVFFNIQYALGLRIGEILKIDLNDINLKTKLINIHGKGRRERVLPLMPELCGLIKKWYKHRKNFYNSKKQQALFLSKKGNRVSDRNMQERFQKIVAKVGPLSMDHVVPHTLRHAFASHAMESESDLIIIKHIMGHASMKSTEIYLHPSMKMLRKSMNNHLSVDILKSLEKKAAKTRRFQAARTSDTGS